MADNSLPDDDELITRRAVRAVRRAVPLAIGLAALAFAASFLLAGTPEPSFQSDGNVELTDERAAGINSSRSRTDALREIDGRMRRIGSDEFLAAVQASMGADGAAVTSLSATAQEDTPVITVTATATNAADAVSAVDTAIDAFVAERDQELRDSLDAELVPLRSQREDQLQTITDLSDELASARATNASQDEISILESRTASALSRLADFDRAIQEREFLAESANGQVRVVNRATEATEVTTNRFARPVQLAVLVFVVGLVAAVLYNRLRGRLHLLDDVRAVTGPDVPILATVPKFRPKFRKGTDALVVGRRNARREAEAFRYLRTSIEVATEQHTPIVVAFTSANANEGKSVTAGNYALATARAGRTVGVLDGDLLNSSVAGLFDIGGDNAFLALMNGEVKVRDGGFHGVSTSDKPVELLVRPQGTLPIARQELPTDAVERVFDDLCDEYDVVVVDCPPVLAVSDSVVLTRSADVAVLVVRMGKTARRDLEKALTQLDQSRVKLAGVVITHSTDKSESYYGYGYAYGNTDN